MNRSTSLIASTPFTGFTRRALKKLLTDSSDFGAARLDPCELRTVVPYTYTLSERSAELHGRRSGGYDEKCSDAPSILITEKSVSIRERTDPASVQPPFSGRGASSPFPTRAKTCENDLCPGRPMMVVTPENIKKLEKLILAARTIKLWQITKEFQIIKKRVGGILHEHLDMRKSKCPLGTENADTTQQAPTNRSL
ncbi:hypothetical protein EVAR_92362_1 [Eumeta japonica]|uniref:Uncharacterized protein n=1 Tax=Eumeta variegata TaxID=151549 RepID=A0A4C1TL89_EUMVA|nr:hypothetical protein EVAR_92362_1 [Eumeta japonica]